jgi:hypothetical protein
VSAKPEILKHDSAPANFLEYVAAARQEVQMLYEMAIELGNSLEPPGNSIRAGNAIEAARSLRYFRTVRFSERQADTRVRIGRRPRSVLFPSLEMPLGQELSGWVAENRKLIVNGNPSVEKGHLTNPAKFSSLSSALSVPLEDCSGVVGVLTLYSQEADAFSRDQLRVVKLSRPSSP